MTSPIARGRGARIHALTGLRFVAALAVLLFHYSNADLISFPSALRQAFGQGKAGVGLFFVLSGFVLVYNYHAWFKDGVRVAPYLRFLRARVARVYPMHAVALLLSVPLMLYFLRAHPGVMEGWYSSGLTPGVVAGAWLASLMLVQVYVPHTVFEYFWNAPAWSVACEFFFYATFPLFLSRVLSGRKRVDALLWLIVALYAVEIIVVLALVVLARHAPVHDKGALLDYLVTRLPFVRIWEFFLGCALGAIWVQSDGRPRAGRLVAPLEHPSARNVLLACSLACAAMLPFVPKPPAPWGDVVGALQGNALFTPLFAVIVIALASGPTLLSPLLEHPTVMLLGEASYSLYITQWLPISALTYARSGGSQVPAAVALAALLGTVAASVAFFVLLERPARQILRGRATIIEARPVGAHGATDARPAMAAAPTGRAR